MGLFSNIKTSRVFRNNDNEGCRSILHCLMGEEIKVKARKHALKRMYKLNLFEIGLCCHHSKERNQANVLFNTTVTSPILIITEEMAYASLLYTFFPPIQVSRTFIFTILSTGVSKGFASRTMKSAKKPGRIFPLQFSSKLATTASEV